MIKTIIFDSGEELTLNNNNEWLFNYQDQTGQDIVPTLGPTIAGILKMIGGLAEEVSDIENIDVKDILRLANTSAFDEGMIYATSISSTDLITIAWAMAKTADPSINKEPRMWMREYQEFPLFDTIVPAIAELIVKGWTSSKNWERLTENLKSLQPKQAKKKTTKK